MCKILSKKNCQQIDVLRQEFRKYEDMSWLCEGSSLPNGELVNILFNNNTEEWAKADFNGLIIDKFLTTTSLSDVQKMASIQGKISTIVENA